MRRWCRSTRGRRARAGIRGWSRSVVTSSGGARRGPARRAPDALARQRRVHHRRDPRAAVSGGDRGGAERRGARRRASFEPVAATPQPSTGPSAGSGRPCSGRSACSSRTRPWRRARRAPLSRSHSTLRTPNARCSSGEVIALRVGDPGTSGTSAATSGRQRDRRAGCRRDERLAAVPADCRDCDEAAHRTSRRMAAS